MELPKLILLRVIRRLYQCIKDNLNFTKLQDDAVVMAMPVESALKDLEHKVKFDFIFMDPPYDKLYEKDAIDFS